MNLDEIEIEIALLQPKATLIAQRLNELNKQKRELESREFIRVNRITRDQVEHRDRQPCNEWFGTAWNFAKYLKGRGNVKPWVDWNGLIYNATDFLNGRMPEGTRGHAEHLPE